MNNLWITYGIPLLVIILMHEIGHFIVAKICNVGVKVFSIGFGKRLFGIKYGETDYRLSLLPFGGYCKLEKELEYSLKPTAFTNKSYRVKLIVSFAGCLINIITGLIAWQLRIYYPFLSIFAYFSIFLGLFNLIPFPGLDGSYPFLFLLEKKYGKKKGLKVMKKLVKSGINILIILQFYILIAIALCWPIMRNILKLGISIIK